MSVSIATSFQLLQDWSSCALLGSYDCTPAESFAQTASLIYMVVICAATGVHLVYQRIAGTHKVHKSHQATGRRNRVKLLVVAVIANAVFWPCIVLRTSSIRWLHPFQCAPVQYAGAMITLFAALGFVRVHIDMGSAWSPVAERKDEHKLVTSGIFAHARHPMYIVTLWAAVGILMGTLNIAWALLFFFLAAYVILRIPHEEVTMLASFGEEYRRYRESVSALGPTTRVFCAERAVERFARSLDYASAGVGEEEQKMKGNKKQN